MEIGDFRKSGALSTRSMVESIVVHTILLALLLMCAGELLTTVRERLPIVVVVFNDASLSLIDIKQRQRKLDEAGVSLGDVDWRALAASVGMAAHAATTERELEDAIGRALDHTGPTLIDARVDPRGYSAMLKAVRG